MNDIEILAKNLTETFVSAFRDGIESFQRAGDALAKLIEIDPAALEKIQKEHGVPTAVSRLFLDIGRGRLLPQLFTAPGCVKRLPLAHQKRLVDGQVEALVMKPDGTVDTIKVDIMSADPALVRQVVSPRGLRTLAEQRAALVSEANAALAAKEAGAKNAAPMPWHVVGKTIVVRAGVTLTQKDLAAMMQAVS